MSSVSHARKAAAAGADGLVLVACGAAQRVLLRAGLAADSLGVRAEKGFDQRGSAQDEQTKAWRDIWAAGQGVRAVKRVQTAAELVAELVAGYAAARRTP